MISELTVKNPGALHRIYHVLTYQPCRFQHSIFYFPLSTSLHLSVIIGLLVSFCVHSGPDYKFDSVTKHFWPIENFLDVGWDSEWDWEPSSKTRLSFHSK